MSATLHSFKDIFDNTSVQLNKIAIPLIQRDYAQGRMDNDVQRVRRRFLDSLYNAITKEPITLDFIYGDIDENGTMTPLDGQQRLTTLFLLYWYAAKKEKISEDKYAFLSKFSYETRYSARYFCDELVKFTPSFETALSSDIKNQSWFPFDWKNDPTISSMLVMLDAIDDLFKGVSGIWSALEKKAITFYFLPIKDMGLTDELYIKMNSRGKPLTLFEQFKAELEREIRALDEKTGQSSANRIIEKIDKEWTELLWNYRNSGSDDADDNIIDDEFLRYFRFVCDIICYRKGNSPQSYDNDVFNLLGKYFSAKNEDAATNIDTLESFFDCWCNINGYNNPTSFLKSFMSFKHENGKIIVSSWYKVDIFEDCIHSYYDKYFPLNRIVLLYAITVYLQHQNDVDYADFVRRIRIVNNLIQNSENEISDRLDGNRIPAIIQAVDAIILKGAIYDSIEKKFIGKNLIQNSENEISDRLDGNRIPAIIQAVDEIILKDAKCNYIEKNFNEIQIQEELEKIKFLADNPTRADEVFELEDHSILKGQIGIVGLDNLAFGSRFASLFTCHWDLIDCALMTIGNYGQQERNNKWRYQFASHSMQFAWDELFHKSANKIGFENTKEVLAKLLETNQDFNNDTLDAIISDYLNKCEKNGVYPWTYYYVKYPVFRPGRYGKLSNDDVENKPYMYSVMQTKTQRSQNTYMPYLKEADDDHLSKDEYGQYLVYKDVKIACKNDSYVIYKIKGDSLKDIGTIKISQNEQGIDTEDRIIRLKKYIAENNLK